MKKIIVIGSPGAGKSTFARKLRDKTSLPLYYLDLIWHKPDRTHIPRAEFDVALDKILHKDSWIIDGNYSRTLELRIASCDTVLFFDLPTEICLAGARARIGIEREEMPWTETEMDEEFTNEIAGFSSKESPIIYELLQKYQEGKTIVIFHSREEADTFIQNNYTSK